MVIASLMMATMLIIIVKPSPPIVLWSCPCLLLSGASPCTSSLRIVYLFQATHIFSKELLLFLAQLFSYLFQKCIPGFWAWLAKSLFNINWIFVFQSNFSCLRKLKFVWEWVLGTSASSDQGLTWHKCKSCETSKRLHRLHLSLYLWDCICWNSLSNFL